MSIIKDKSLARQGGINVGIAKMRMSALMHVRERFFKEKPFKNLKIGMALHVTKETAVLVETLSDGGAEIFISSCNPLSTQDDVASYLAQQKNIEVFAYKGEDEKDYYKFINKVIDSNPNITIDDGCDLVTIIHTERKKALKNIIGGCEETTTGINRLRVMERKNELLYPMIAVNDNQTKHLFDNYYGTGQSTLDGILRSTNILFAGKTVVVCGYGECGKGVSERAKGLAANIIVVETNPLRALKAAMDGNRVMPIKEAAGIGDIFITVTGGKHILRPEHMKKMKNGVILANSGHFDIEIDIKGLEKISKRKKRVRHFLDEYDLGNKKIYIAGEGRLVNLASAEGHPSEVMAMSFCGQALACEYLVKNQNILKNKVYKLPEKIDIKIASLQLQSMGIRIDKLTDEQKKYAESWKEGT